MKDRPRNPRVSSIPAPLPACGAYLPGWLGSIRSDCTLTRKWRGPAPAGPPPLVQALPRLALAVLDLIPRVRAAVGENVAALRAGIHATIVLRGGLVASALVPMVLGSGRESRRGAESQSEGGCGCEDGVLHDLFS